MTEKTTSPDELGAASCSATGYICAKCLGGNPIVFRGPRAKCHVCGIKRVCVWTKLPNDPSSPTRREKRWIETKTL